MDNYLYNFLPNFEKEIVDDFVQILKKTNAYIGGIFVLNTLFKQTPWQGKLPDVLDVFLSSDQLQIMDSFLEKFFQSSYLTYNRHPMKDMYDSNFLPNIYGWLDYFNQEENITIRVFSVKDMSAILLKENYGIDVLNFYFSFKENNYQSSIGRKVVVDKLKSKKISLSVEYSKLLLFEGSTIFYDIDDFTKQIIKVFIDLDFQISTHKTTLQKKHIEPIKSIKKLNEHLIDYVIENIWRNAEEMPKTFLKLPSLFVKNGNFNNYIFYTFMNELFKQIMIEKEMTEKTVLEEKLLMAEKNNDTNKIRLYKNNLKAKIKQIDGIFEEYVEDNDLYKEMQFLIKKIEDYPFKIYAEEIPYFYPLMKRYNSRVYKVYRILPNKSELGDDNKIKYIYFSHMCEVNEQYDNQFLSSIENEMITDIVMQTDYTIKNYLDDDPKNIVFFENVNNNIFFYASNLTYLLKFLNNNDGFVVECIDTIAGMPIKQNTKYQKWYLKLNLDSSNSALPVNCVYNVVKLAENGVKIFELNGAHTLPVTTNLKNVGIYDYYNIFNEEVDLVSAARCGDGSSIKVWENVTAIIDL